MVRTKVLTIFQKNILQVSLSGWKVLHVLKTSVSKTPKAMKKVLNEQEIIEITCNILSICK